MKSVTIYLTDGSDVTWFAEKDDLTGVNMHESGSLLVMCKNGVREGYTIGAWVTFHINYEGDDDGDARE